MVSRKGERVPLEWADVERKEEKQWDGRGGGGGDEFAWWRWKGERVPLEWADVEREEEKQWDGRWRRRICVVARKGERVPLKSVDVERKKGKQWDGEGRVGGGVGLRRMI